MEKVCEDVVKLLEGSFDFVLILDDAERIVHASPAACREIGVEPEAILGMEMGAIPSSLAPDRWKLRVESFRKAMAEAREKKKGLVVLPPGEKADDSYAISYGYAETDQGPLFLFQGNKASRRGKYSEWEKDERIKELACLYAVADWIEASASIREFFTQLPRYLAPGMLHSERAVIHAVYQGVEYGRKPAGRHYIATTLEVSKQMRGKIIVGYDSDAYSLLPEEQKMLDEIGRMLELALDRKELRERLASKQAEEMEYTRRLRELETEIEAREKELQGQSEKLATVHSYLDRINRDWEESKAQFATMFMAIPDKVAMINSKRDVVMTNWGTAVQGEKCFKTFFNIETPCVDCRLMRIVKDKTPITMEVRHEDEYFEVHALPIFNQEHEVEGIFEFYKDVTRERVFEQQLQQADKLASLGQLVSGVGHEINNPNQFIRGNIKIIQQALADMLPIMDDYYKEHPDLRIARLKYDFFRDHIMRLVSDMEHGSERIKGVVESLKRFARKDDGLLIDMIDANAIVDASARLTQKQVHKSCDIELELVGHIPVFAGNAQKIEQVLVNLILNASQAMPEDRRGRIVVKTRYENGNVVIEVRDNGKGMSERTLKKIFDPFFTTRRASGGTGLGLSIAYRIIEEHGGKISVASKIDAGTVFTIAIPAKQGAKTQETPGSTEERRS
jgi:signal transduction histidine kinase